LALGAIPWVANPELDSMGVGAVEVIPRQVLALHDQNGHIAQVAQHEIHRLGAMPLNHLGLEQVLVRAGSPQLDGYAARPLAGRFAGVLMWFNGGSFPTDPDVLTVFDRARREGVPVVIVGELPDDAALDAFDMDIGKMRTTKGAPTMEVRSPHVGMEVLPKALPGDLWPAVLRNPDAPGTEVWLRIRADADAYSDAIAITPWGAFAQERFWKTDLPQDKGARWAINPIEFFKRGFRLDGAIPIPDVTSESGRRLLLIHIDGDGFPSRAELPKSPLASELMLTDFLQRYELPTTVSVIQGEVGGNGLYKALSPLMEDIARRMFRLPHVELASHTFSHPFFWAEAQLGTMRGDRPVGLKIPNYSFNIDTEVAGSADYINRNLAPPGKRTRMLLWSGDTEPLEAPVRAAYAAGLLNMNSGYTTISKANPSLALVAPIGLMKGEFFQVYAPNQNENVYTNDWTGPFYGFDRVLETFEMTELPRRLKPVNIYYHTYIASKPASIQSLHKVYQWAMNQPLHPIYSSEYALRVLDWRRATVARDWTSAKGERLQLRAGGPYLRQWRIDSVATTRADQGWAGSTVHGPHRFLNATASVASVVVNKTGGSQIDVKNDFSSAWRGPEMLSANARLISFTEQPGSGLWQSKFRGYAALAAEFSVACEVDRAASTPGLNFSRQNSRLLITSGRKTAHNFSLQDGAEQTIVFRCTR
jgi:polysaccharide biosynthesis protein PelA